MADWQDKEKLQHFYEKVIKDIQMLDAKVTLVYIVHKVLDTYNTNEGLVVKKMRSKYVNKIATILPIIYTKDKVQYFNNKLAMMISKANHGKSIN